MSPNRLTIGVATEEESKNAVSTHAIPLAEVSRLCCSSGMAGATSDCNNENEVPDSASTARIRFGPVLRRVMCNELNEKVRQVAQRTTEQVIQPLTAGVRRDFGRQAGQQPTQGFGSVALQGEEVLELADHPFDDLALARCPAAVGL